MGQREEELRMVDLLIEDLMRVLAHPTARTDYLAIAWPVTDEPYSRYTAAMYRLLERKRVLLGLEEVTPPDSASPRRPD